MSATSSERRGAAARCAAFALAVSACPALADEAGTPRLVATPSTCVALHRGQVCYREVRLSWPLLGAGRWCLERDDGHRLLCWRDDERDHHLHDYTSASAERYRLVRADEGAIVATAEVRTAWVYRTGRRSASGWRLF